MQTEKQAPKNLGFYIFGSVGNILIGLVGACVAIYYAEAALTRTGIASSGYWTVALAGLLGILIFLLIGNLLHVLSGPS